MISRYGGKKWHYVPKIKVRLTHPRKSATQSDEIYEIPFFPGNTFQFLLFFLLFSGFLCGFANEFTLPYFISLLVCSPGLL